ncbi:MAG: glutamate racemase [Oscillospiraceae bacterium]|nr:glutamate racemase [Oscillospiraceae bacterium]
MNHFPIGVFDSGLGGLTAVRELRRILPNENIVYFGDTGRVPYGTRSAETIEHYAFQDMRFLLSKKVKLIIAACGTVSSVAAGAATGLNIPFTGVVVPAAHAAAAETRNLKVGIIGTSATIRSKSYEEELHRINAHIEVFSRDCPLFVSMVENGFTSPDNEITKAVVEHYIRPFVASGVDTLILGCTHFPILKEAIANVLGARTSLIDAGYEAAHYAKSLMEKGGIMNSSTEAGKCSFYVTDQIQNFSSIAGLFLGEDITGDVNRVDLDTL